MYYYLAFKQKKDEFKIIPIGVKTLPEIDKFTTGFKDEEQLKSYLALKFVPNSYLDNKDFTKELVIHYNYKEKKYLHKPFGIIYQGDDKFLDVEYLKHYMMSKSYDLNFINSLYKKFKDYYHASSHIYILNQHVMERSHGYYNSAFNDPERLNNMINDEMYNTFEGIICESRKNKNTGIYEKEISYRYLHCLSAFCADYEKKLKLQKEQEKDQNKTNDINLTFNDIKNISLDDINSVKDFTDEFILDEFGRYGDLDSEDNAFVVEAKKYYNPDMRRK